MLKSLGVELVEGDFKNDASLARACTGVQAAISTASSTLSRQAGDSIESVDQQGHLAFLEAARSFVRARFSDFTTRCFEQPLDAPAHAASTLERTYIGSVKTDHPAKVVFDPFAARAAGGLVVS